MLNMNPYSYRKVYHATLIKEASFCNRWRYFRVPQLVTHREYTSERCPARGDIATVEPLHLRLMKLSETGWREYWCIPQPSTLT